jgi:hypothetical protein
VRHVRECAQCETEVERLGSVLGELRHGIWEWSKQESSGLDRMAWSSGAAASRQVRVAIRLRISLAAAALVLVAAGPIYKYMNEKRPEAESSRADVALMERLEDGVSRAVPRAMEPLLEPDDPPAWGEDR